MKMRSLVSGASAAARRAIAARTTANGTPTSGTAGFATGRCQYLHIIVKVNDGTSVQWRLWLKNAVSGEWCLDTRPGIDGLVTLTRTASYNPSINIIEIAGADAAYIELLTFTGSFTTGVDVWLAGSSL